MVERGKFGNVGRRGNIRRRGGGEFKKIYAKEKRHVIGY